MYEITMRDHVRVLFRRKWAVTISFFTIIITAAIGLVLTTPVYESQVKILIPADKSVRNAPAAMTQSEIILSNPVMDRAVKFLGLYARPLDYEKNFASQPRKFVIKVQASAISKELEKLKLEQREPYMYRLGIEDLKRHIKVEPVRGTNIFIISVMDYSPIGATIIANIVSRSYVIFDLEQQLADVRIRCGEEDPSVIQLKENIDGMVKRLNGEPLPGVEAIGPASVKIIEQASVPLKPAGMPKTTVFLLAILAAVFSSVALAFIFDLMDQTFKSPKEIESYLGITSLGSIRKNVAKDDYHVIADEIYLELKDKGIKSILFTATARGEGVTSTVVNLGKYMSSVSGHKTLVIDANLRHPAVHTLFDVPNTAGLGNILEDRGAFDGAVKDIGPKLSVLTAGNTALRPVVLFDSHKMAELIKSAKTRYDIILVDAPSLSRHKDSQLIAGATDSVCLVISEIETRRQAAKAAISPLVEKKTVFLGAILNKRIFPIPKWLYKKV